MMMEIISYDNNAEDAIDCINTNFGEDVVNASDSASSAVTKLNAAFGSGQGMAPLSAESSARDFVDDLNANFELLDKNAKTFTFLHISDTHTKSTAVNTCKLNMEADNGIAFTLLTGDIYHDRNDAPTLYEALTTFGHPLLAVPGNHDAINRFQRSLTSLTSHMKTIVTDNRVEWGDISGVSPYWFADFTLSEESKLRIIGINDYDVFYQNYLLNSVISPSQIHWFIARIKELLPTDYLFVCKHEAPINTEWETYARASTAAGKRGKNAFCSNRIFEWGSGCQNSEVLPLIINAYKNGQTITGDDRKVIISNSSNGQGNVPVKTFYIGGSVTIDGTTYDGTDADGSNDADFSSCSPCTFLGFLCGHTHADMIDYHPTYQDQLVMMVDTSSNSSLDESDLSKNTYNRINKVTLDFAREEITIERIGDKTTKTYTVDKSVSVDYYDLHDTGYTYPAVTRDTITFPFKKTQL